MKTEVVCVSSISPKQPYYIYKQFLASVRRFGVEPTILGWREHWGGLMTKPRRFREFLRKGHQQGELLIITDAWDVVFAAHPDEIGEAYLKRWPDQPIVFNAERNCFPCSEIVKGNFDAIAVEHSITTPWQYLNSGFMVGKPENILALLESMNLDEIPDDHQLPDKSWFNPNDQDHFQRRFVAVQPVPMTLDYNADICMTGHGTTVDQLDFSGPRIKQTLTGTYPMAFHFNGDAKNILQPAVLAHMKL